MAGGVTLAILGIASAALSLTVFGAAGVLAEYPIAYAIVAGLCGPIAVPGLIMLGIWYSKRRIMLAEQLPAEKINAIAGKILVDPTKGFSNL